MEIKCTDCKKSLMEPVDLKWQSWTRLMNFMQIQNLQGEISDFLYEQLVDDLMWFKPVGDEDDAESEESSG